MSTLREWLPPLAGIFSAGAMVVSLPLMVWFLWHGDKLASIDANLMFLTGLIVNQQAERAMTKADS